MKILMINHFPLAGSGSGTYTKNLAVHLASLGHEVCIVLPENSSSSGSIQRVHFHPVYFTECKKSSEYSESKGTTMMDPIPFNFPCFTTHPKSTTTFKDLSEAQLNQYKTAFSSAIKEEVENFKPDIIHGQHVWILSALAAEYNIPLILTAHGTDLMGIDKWEDMKFYADKAMDACRKVISISKDNCALLEDKYPQYKDKIVMMRNGYDPNMFYQESIDVKALLSIFGIKEEDFVGKSLVVFAGKLTNFKGVDVLLDAIYLYEQNYSDIITIIAGDGEEWNNLHAQAKKLKLNSVHFVGNVNQRTLRMLYNIADVSIVPSRREPFGLVALEAMACGTPVIASNEGGLPDFVNSNVGVLVKPEDKVALFDAIRKMIVKGNEITFYKWRKQIAAYARENYAQDKIIKEVENLYNKVLGKE